jgi:hypothetical protein
MALNYNYFLYFVNHLKDMATSQFRFLPLLFWKFVTNINGEHDAVNTSPLRKHHTHDISNHFYSYED